MPWRHSRTAVRKFRWVHLLVLCGVLLAAASSNASAGPVGDELPDFVAHFCRPQAAAFDAVQAEIKAHNARHRVFIVPREQAALNAYNAEARMLRQRNSAARTELNTCIKAIGALAEKVRLPPPSPLVVNRITDARKKIPSEYSLPHPNVRKRGYSVPKGSEARPLYEVLREVSPPKKISGSLRGEPRPKVGDRDPAYPKGTIGKNAKDDSAVSVDHIVSLAEIVHMPGFLKLPPDLMYAVVNARINFQYLSFRANQSKQSRSVGQMAGVDPDWQRQQVALEAKVRKELLALIRKLESLGGT